MQFVCFLIIRNVHFAIRLFLLPIIIDIRKPAGLDLQNTIKKEEIKKKTLLVLLWSTGSKECMSLMI